MFREGNIPTKYVIDEVVLNAGYSVLRLPPNHCVINPIGMGWSQVKKCSYYKAKLILRFFIYWMVLIQTIVTVGLFKQRRDGYNASNQVLKKKQIILKSQFLKKKQIFSSNTETREEITSCRCSSWVFYFHSTICTFFWVDINLNI